jgi:enoyl-CoA hydratase
MPEVGIGFFPDVGATWFLPRLPGQVGLYCALTGDRFDAADGVGCGVATVRVRSASFPDLIDALCTAIPVDSVLAAFAQPAGEGKVLQQRALIDRLFAGNRIEDILAALDDAEGTFARSAAIAIRGKSPLSLKLALAQFRRGQTIDFDECMRTEFRVVSRVVRGHDFYEGIRAVIVDKDQMPRWQPATLAAVDEAKVEHHFAPVTAELELP